MKTLIIHPDDSSTKFLKPIYRSIITKTVITGGITKKEITRLIETHDRTIFLGHGSPEGLLSVNQFFTNDFHVVDIDMVPTLRFKKNIISIWCHADKFMNSHQLNGFFTGMFISEIGEALYYDFYDVTESMIDESNYTFSESVSRHIDNDLAVLYENVSKEYGGIAKQNEIAHFNYKRLFYRLYN